jgi:site-specific DNA recombinase
LVEWLTYITDAVVIEVRRITVTTAGFELDIRREGIALVIREMVVPRRLEAAE